MEYNWLDLVLMLLLYGSNISTTRLKYARVRRTPLIICITDMLLCIDYVVAAGRCGLCCTTKLMRWIGILRGRSL